MNNTKDISNIIDEIINLDKELYVIDDKAEAMLYKNLSDLGNIFEKYIEIFKYIQSLSNNYFHSEIERIRCVSKNQKTIKFTINFEKKIVSMDYDGLTTQLYPAICDNSFNYKGKDKIGTLREILEVSDRIENCIFSRIKSNLNMIKNNINNSVLEKKSSLDKIKENVFSDLQDNINIINDTINKNIHNPQLPAEANLF